MSIWLIIVALWMSCGVHAGIINTIRHPDSFLGMWTDELDEVDHKVAHLLGTTVGFLLAFVLSACLGPICYAHLNEKQ